MGEAGPSLKEMGIEDEAENFKMQETGKEAEKVGEYQEITQQLEDVLKEGWIKDRMDYEEKTRKMGQMPVGETPLTMNMRHIKDAREHGFEPDYCPRGVGMPFVYKGNESKFAMKEGSISAQGELAYPQNLKDRYETRRKMLNDLDKVGLPFEIKTFKDTWESGFKYARTDENMYKEADASQPRPSKRFYNWQVRYCNLKEATRRGIIKENEIIPILKSMIK